MFLFYVPSLFKKGDTIQEGTLFKGGHYLRKYGKPIFRALSRFLNLDSNIFSPFFLSPPNSRWATALLLFNEFFKKQLKFEINCIFKMPTWSYFNLFTLKNWVIFSHVEKNCQNQKKYLLWPTPLQHFFFFGVAKEKNVLWGTKGKKCPLVDQRKGFFTKSAEPLKSRLHEIV